MKKQDSDIDKVLDMLKPDFAKAFRMYSPKATKRTIGEALKNYWKYWAAEQKRQQKADKSLRYQSRAQRLNARPKLTKRHGERRGLRVKARPKPKPTITPVCYYVDEFAEWDWADSTISRFP